jgi:hypothetical protein
MRTSNDTTNSIPVRKAIHLLYVAFAVRHSPAEISETVMSKGSIQSKRRRGLPKSLDEIP